MKKETKTTKTAEQTETKKNSRKQTAEKKESEKNMKKETKNNKKQNSTKSVKETKQTAEQQNKETMPVSRETIKIMSFDDVTAFFTNKEKELSCYVKESESCVTIHHKKARIVRAYIRKNRIRISMTENVYTAINDELKELVNYNYRAKEHNMPHYCDITLTDLESLKKAILTSIA